MAAEDELREYLSKPEIIRARAKHDELQDPAKNEAYYASEALAEKYQPDPEGKRLKEPRVQWIAQRLKGVKSACDVGATDGFMSELLPEGCEYVGIELNRAAIENAYPRAKGNIFLANAVTFEYPVKRFDVAICGEILEHIPDPEALLRRIAPSLTDEGYIITTSPVGLHEALPVGNMEHLREWSPEQYRAMHERAGYTVIEQDIQEVYRTEQIVRCTNCIVAVPKGGL